MAEDTRNFFQRALGIKDDADRRAASNIGASLIQQGQIIAAAGLANIQPTAEARQGIMQGGLQTGQDMATALRNRFYQKEFDLLSETGLKPLHAKLKEAATGVQSRLSMATQPVMTTMSPEEGQMLAETLQGQTPGIEQIDQGKTAEGGVKPPKTIPTMAPPAPNPAMNPGRLGATVVQDQLAIMDPATGQPVAITSSRGLQIQQEAVNDFWQVNQDVNMQMMDLLARHAGNPFVDNAMQNLLKNTANMAGSAVTGKTDPMEMQKWMDTRKAQEAEMAQRWSETGINQLKTDLGRGGAYAGARDAMTLQEQYPDQFSDPAMQDVLSGKRAASEQEEAKLGAQSSLLRQLEKDQLEAREKAGMIVIPKQIVSNPRVWPKHLMNSYPPFRADMERHFGNAKSATMAEFARMSPETRREQLLMAGASQEVANMGSIDWTHEEAAPYIATIARQGSHFKEAMANSYADTIPLIKSYQPELIPVMQDSVRQYLPRVNAEYRKRTGQDMSDRQQERFLLDWERNLAAAWADHPVTSDPMPDVAARLSEHDQMSRYEAGQEFAERARTLDENLSLLDPDEVGRKLGLDIEPARGMTYTPNLAAEAPTVSDEPESRPDDHEYKAGQPLEMTWAKPEPKTELEKGAQTDLGLDNLEDLRSMAPEMTDDQLTQSQAYLAQYRDANVSVLPVDQLDKISAIISAIQVEQNERTVGRVASRVGTGLTNWARGGSPEEVAARKAEIARRRLSLGLQ